LNALLDFRTTEISYIKMALIALQCQKKKIEKGLNVRVGTRYDLTPVP